MRSTRRSFVVKSAALAVPGLALSPRLSFAADGAAGPAKKLRILILGGTGFTGPHQVRYALSRGHEVTLFNRGREPKTWPSAVEELIGDRNTGDLKALEGRGPARSRRRDEARSGFYGVVTGPRAGRSAALRGVLDGDRACRP